MSMGDLSIFWYLQFLSSRTWTILPVWFSCLMEVEERWQETGGLPGRADCSTNTKFYWAQVLSIQIFHLLGYSHTKIFYSINVYCMVWYGMVWYGMVWYGIPDFLVACVRNFLELTFSLTDKSASSIVSSRPEIFLSYLLYSVGDAYICCSCSLP